MEKTAMQFEKTTVGCRHCNEPIEVKNEFSTTGKVIRTKKDAKWSYYGGLVCSKSCEENSVLEMNSSMPHAGVCKSVPQSIQREINERWKN